VYPSHRRWRAGSFGCPCWEGTPRALRILQSTSFEHISLEKERYRYQRALSELSGSDISNHNDEPEDIVHAVRNWFRGMSSRKPPSGTVIWEDFNEFMADFYQAREEQGYKDKDLQLMPTREYVDFVEEWLKVRR
jgi:hypothetical protein